MRNIRPDLVIKTLCVCVCVCVCGQSTDTEERLEVTRLLAKMFSPQESRLASEHKSLWTCFLARQVFTLS